MLELRPAREAAGLSQRKLAPRCGVERTTIQKVEAGKLVPSVALARRIEAELKVEPETIFGPAQACGCGCEGMTFSAYLAGHAPKAGGPVASRKDRAERADAGGRLRTLRIQLGLTQAELAGIVDSRPSTIASVEQGRDLPGERLARALGKAVGVPDLFPLGPCPCGCGGRTVGGRFMRGHQPLSDEGRQKVSASKHEFWDSDESAALRAEFSEQWREGWQKGGTPQRALLKLAKEGGTPIPISGRTRQRYSGRWDGTKGGRTRGYSDEQAAEVVALKREHPEWGRVTLKRHTGLTEDQVRQILKLAGDNPS